MTKEEYTKKLQKYYENHKLKDADSYGEGYTDGIAEALDYAIGLAKELDESKKVIIPQFVAEWIGKSARKCDYEPIRMAEWIADNIDEGTDYHFDWLENLDNQYLLLAALINNYEVEKEPK